MKKIFILTGEASGDKLASTVISKLKQYNENIEYLSVGGSNLSKLGIKSIFDINEITYIGFTSVILNILKIKKKIDYTVNEIIKFALEYSNFEKNKKDLEKIIQDNSSDEEMKELAKLELKDLTISHQKNELKLKIDSLSLKNSGEYALSFQMDNLELFKNDDSLSISNFSGKLGNAPINGELLYFHEESKIEGSLNIDEFAIPKEFFSKTPLKGKFEKISGTVDFESVNGDLNGNLSITNQLGLEMSGDINIIKRNGNILLKNLNLYGEDSNLKVNGVATLPSSDN